MGIVRIVRPANEIEARILDQPDIPVDGGIGDRIAPASLVLMDVGTAEITVHAVEEETLVRRPGDCPEAEFRLDAVAVAPGDDKGRHRTVKTRLFGAPQPDM